MNNGDYRGIFQKVKNGEMTQKEATIQIEEILKNKKKNPVLYAASEWIETNDIGLTAGQSTPLKIIFFNYELLPDSIREQISANKNWEVIAINNGMNYQKIGDSSFTIDYCDTKQMAEFIHTVANLKEYRILFICKQYPDVTEENIKIILNENIIPLFILIQTLINLKLAYPMQVSCVFSSTVTYLQATYSGLSGFVRTLKQESSKVSCRLIETDDIEKHFNKILSEACSQND
ncbi:MAG: hypothetical protein JXB88_13455, partial [Spirochaetales bacterium]|nr:hypothetical protein [Spirochaetales bacterium]